MYEEGGDDQLRASVYDELRAVTNDFSPAQKLGEGGFGGVYKGSVRPLNPKGDRITVSVKRLDQQSLQKLTKSIKRAAFQRGKISSHESGDLEDDTLYKTQEAMADYQSVWLSFSSLLTCPKSSSSAGGCLTVSLKEPGLSPVML